MALAPLIVAVSQCRGASAACAARSRSVLCTGFVYFAGTVYWVVEVMQLHGGLHPLVAALGVGVLMVAYLAIYPAVFAVLLWRAIARGASGGRLVGAGVVGGDRVGAIVDCGRVPVGAARRVAGDGAAGRAAWRASPASYGLSLLLACVSTAAAALGLSPRSRARASRPIGRRGSRSPSSCRWRLARVARAPGSLASPIRVGLVQGNVAQEQKYRSALPRRHHRRAICSSART